MLLSFAPVTSFLGVLRIMRCEQFYKQTFTAILIISNSGFVNSTIELYIAMKHLWSFMIWSLHIECKWYKTSKGSVLPKVIIYIKQQKRRWKWLLICWFFLDGRIWETKLQIRFFVFVFYKWHLNQKFSFKSPCFWQATVMASFLQTCVVMQLPHELIHTLLSEERIILFIENKGRLHE